MDTTTRKMSPEQAIRDVVIADHALAERVLLLSAELAQLVALAERRIADHDAMLQTTPFLQEEAVNDDTTAYTKRMRVSLRWLTMRGRNVLAAAIAAKAGK